MCLIWLILIKKTKFILTKNIKYISELFISYVTQIYALPKNSHKLHFKFIWSKQGQTGFRPKIAEGWIMKVNRLQVKAQLVVFVLILLWFDCRSRIFPLVFSSLKLFRVLTRYTFCNLTLQNNFIVQIFIWPFEIRLNLPPIYQD